MPRSTPTSATTPAGPGPAVLHGPAEVTGDEMVAAMDAVGVDGALLVSPLTMYRFDASYAIEVHASTPAASGSSSRSTRQTRRRRDGRGVGGHAGRGRSPPDADRDVSPDPADPGLNRVLAAAAGIPCR